MADVSHLGHISVILLSQADLPYTFLDPIVSSRRFLTVNCGLYGKYTTASPQIRLDLWVC